MRGVPGKTHDESGSVAVEFAFVAPVLLVLMLGVVEITNLLAQDRKVALAAQAMVDMVARSDRVDAADKAEIAEAVRLVMEPFAGAYTATVAIVAFDEDGKPDMNNDETTQFAVAGEAPFAASELEGEAEGLGAGNDAVVIGRIRSAYAPILSTPFVGKGATVQSLNSQRPRRQHITTDLDDISPSGASPVR